MKRRRLFALLLAAACLFCACSGTAAVKPNAALPDSRSEMTKWAVNERQLEFSPETRKHGKDAVIQWAAPAMEAHIRSLLNKPEGDIRRSDVWDIQVLRLNANGIHTRELSASFIYLSINVSLRMPCLPFNTTEYHPPMS